MAFTYDATRMTVMAHIEEQCLSDDGLPREKPAQLLRRYIKDWHPKPEQVCALASELLYCCSVELFEDADPWDRWRAAKPPLKASLADIHGIADVLLKTVGR